MAITRSVWTDDDGTGSTGTIINNAELQKIYNNIDADFAVGTWVAQDLSGAGLAITGTGLYQRVRQVATITIQIIYPTNSHAGAASFSLPYVAQASAHAGFYLGFGPSPMRFWAVGGTAKLEMLNHANGAPLSNQALSGVNMIIHGSYFV